MKGIALNLIRWYQTWSKYTSPTCRFTPSCSQYTYEALQKYGLLKGVWLGMKRILHCHPFNRGGFDPVP